jgi:hypothetical protein
MDLLDASEKIPSDKTGDRSGDLLTSRCSDNARLICIYSPWAKSRKYEPGYRVFGPRAKIHLYEAELYDWTPASLTLKWFTSVTPGTFSGIAPRLCCDSFLQNLLHFIRHTIVRRCACTTYSLR